MKTKLKKGQTVRLIVGADKGKTGEIIKLFPNDYRALVKGINVKKKTPKTDERAKRRYCKYWEDSSFIKFKTFR